MQRATFDTNVFVSALTHAGASARLLKLAEDRAFDLQLSQPILDETAEVLARDFGWTKERTDQARLVLSAISQLVLPHVELDVIERDPDDNRILECSQASKSDYIVTADKDLLDLKTYAGAAIVKPGEFLAVLQQRAR